MTTITHWSGSPDTAAIGRRDLMVVTAAAAAALFLAADPKLEAAFSSTALSPADLVRSFAKPHWDWTVELAVLSRLDTDRSGALSLLWAALELDLDPTQKWRLKPALRLYDLYAATADSAGRLALADLVRARSADPALLARATLWSDASREAHPRMWRTIGPDHRPLGIYLARA